MARRTLIQDGVGMIGQVVGVRFQEGKLTAAGGDYILGKLKEIAKKINGQLSFGSGVSSAQAGNFGGQWLTWTFTGADTPYLIPHSLGRVPVGYKVMRRDKACIIYDANIGDWGDMNFYLQSDTAAATVSLIVF